MKILKSEKGSITIFVLIAMIFFLTVGLSIFATTMNAKTAQERNYKRIQQDYNNMDNLDSVYYQQVNMNH